MTGGTMTLSYRSYVRGLSRRPRGPHQPRTLPKPRTDASCPIFSAREISQISDVMKICNVYIVRLRVYDRVAFFPPTLPSLSFVFMRNPEKIWKIRKSKEKIAVFDIFELIPALGIDL